MTAHARVMDDLIAFWRARIDETEAAANAAREVRAEWYEVAQQAIACTDTIEIGFAYQHIAGHDPARALGDVEADRKLLHEYERLIERRESRESWCRAMPHYTPFTRPGYPSDYDLQREGHFLEQAIPLLESLIAARAAAYRDHPECRARWQ